MWDWENPVATTVRPADQPPGEARSDDSQGVSAFARHPPLMQVAREQRDAVGARLGRSTLLIKLRPVLDHLLAGGLPTGEGDRQGWNGDDGTAPSSSAPPPRRPSISCAIEMDARRPDRPWWRALVDRPWGSRGWSGRWPSGLRSGRGSTQQPLTPPRQRPRG
jgi:hypothetical protein